MQMRTSLSRSPHVRIVFALGAILTPHHASTIVEGHPLVPSPPEGQSLADEPPLPIDGTSSEGPTEGGTPDEPYPTQWTYEDWSSEPWPVQEAPIDYGGVTITANDHNSCQFIVETEQSCYDWSSVGWVRVRLQNCDQQGLDWIAIYRSRSGEVGKDKGYGYWGNSFDWQYTCGTRLCNAPVRNGFNYFDYWWDKLPDGEFRVYLFSDNGYRVKAASAPFTVRNYHGYCYHADSDYPSESPTSQPTEDQCSDTRGRFKLEKNNRKKDCKWASKKKKHRCNQRIKGRGKKKVEDGTFDFLASLCIFGVRDV